MVAASPGDHDLTARSEGAPAERDRERSSQIGLALAGTSLAVVMWGCGPLLVKGIDADSATIVFYRLWIAQPIMIAAAYLTGGRLTWRMIVRAIPTGVCFGASIIFSFVSFNETSIVTATLIPALQPALILLVAGRWFGERRPPRELAYAGLALTGVVLVVLGASGDGHSIVGDLCAVANLIVFTAYFLLAKRARDDNEHAWSFIAAVILVAAVVCSPWALTASHGLDSLAADDWLLLLALAVGPGLLGHGTMTWAHRYLDVSLTSLLALGAPVVSTMGAWILYSQSLGPTQIVGAAVVLVALGSIVRSERAELGVAAEAAATGDLLDR